MLNILELFESQKTYSKGVARWIVRFLRCHGLFHLFINQQSNLALVIPIILPGYGMS